MLLINNKAGRGTGDRYRVKYRYFSIEIIHFKIREIKTEIEIKREGEIEKGIKRGIERERGIERKREKIYYRELLLERERNDEREGEERRERDLENFHLILDIKNKG